MPETPKVKAIDKKRIKVVEETSTWAEDQKNRDYYYDDSHGYVTYDPENDDDDPEDKK